MVALFMHPKHQRDPMQWIGLSVAQLPSSCLKACKALCVPRPSRSIADAVRSDGSVYAAATRRIRKGLPQRGVAAPVQISIGIGLPADAVNLAPCRPRGGPMPMAPSAMRHEQCNTCTRLAGRSSARRWLADDTSEPGNFGLSGDSAASRRAKDWATSCCAEGCPAFVRAPARAMSHAMKANAATLHLILDDESLEYVVWRPA
jgi:hypothetical protein